MDLDFEWDDEKADSNIEKHGISFEEATEVFLDPYYKEVETRETSYGEVRYSVVGKIDDDFFVVVFTYRKNRVRIISARKAHRNERRKYHQI